MKKFLMALAVSAITTFASAAALPSKGNIYSIFPEPEAEHGESAKLVAGDKVRFVVRMLAYNGSEGAPAAWGRQHIGVGSEILDDVTNPLKLGLIVSGKLVEAEIIDVEPIAVVSGASTVYPCTDLHCVYTVKNGDLALPVQLALKGSTKNNPLYVKSDAATDSTEYFLFNNDKWALQATIGGDTATAGMYFCSDADANMAASVWETIGTRVSDYDLTQADFRVNTLNFDNSSYTVENTSVLTGNIVLNGANTTESQTVYAWVKNESVAKMVGDDVNEVLVDGIVRQVKTIKFPAGVTSRPFTVLGLANSGSDEIILSSTQGLRRNAAGDILEMYLSVPVNGAPPPPPSVKLSFKEADPSAIEKTIDTPVLFDKISGTPVYVTINPATSTNFKLKIAHTCGQLDPIAEGNIAMSQTGTPRSTFDGTVYDEISIAAGQTSAVFYVYPLGGTDETASDGIVFTPVLPGTVTGYETQNATLILKNDHKPVVVQPEIPEGADAYDCGVVETTGFELPLTVKDCYRDLQSSFNIKISYSNSKSMTTNVTFKTGAQTIFVKDYGSKDGPRTADVRVTEAGNPYSYTELKIKFDVKPARTVTATLYDASTEESKHEGSEFKEGAEPLIRFVLSEPVASDEDRWAFLEPLNDASRDYVDSTTFEYGVKIPAGQTVSALSNKIALSLKDGNDKTDGLKGEQLEYRVYVRTAAKLTEGEEDTNYASINLELTVDNVHPITTTLYDENLSPIADNGTVSYKIPCGVDYTFMAEVADPAVLDEDAGLVTIWAWTDDEGARIWNYEVVEGGAGETVIEKKINFTQRESTQKLFVMVLDKDMNATYLTNPLSSGSSRTEIMKALPTLRKKGVAEYTINVPVDTKPMVTLTPVDFNYDDLTITEDASTGYIRVKLSDLTKGPLELKVTAKGPTSNPGSFAFLNPNDLSQGTTEVTLTIPMGATEPAESDIYAAGKGLRIKYDLLDGTAGSIAEGWLLTAEVTQYEDMNYFAKGTKRIYIANVAPKMTPVEPANLTTNKSQSVGIPFDLTWTARDVAADLTGTGLKARWYINDVLDATLNSNVPADQAGVTQTTSITLRDEGFTVVRLEISDKDGEEYDGLVTRRWYYEIPASKKLIVTPVGPSMNTKTKYRNAKGLGKGRVWADGGLNNIEAFEQTWSYGIKTAAAGVYAFGYQIGEQIDNGTLAPNGRDVAINEGGNLHKTGENYYVNNEDYNSFFYRWAYVIPNEKGGPGKYELGPIDPKVSPTTLFRETIQLDQWEEKKESYMPRQVEAIFSREHTHGDYAGDINLDGVPDLVVQNFGLGGYVLGDLNAEFDDLADLSENNVDEDFLPNIGKQYFRSNIPGVKEAWAKDATPFGAALETRGIGDGLNDALRKLGIPGAAVNPDHDSDILEVRKAARKLTYTEDEFRAWTEANFAKEWSPENPSDPTVEDTDHDGFPDGYEYYFWYWATVGSSDAEGKNWKHYSGERYNPNHPEKGDLISWETIAAEMNPTVANKRRSDLVDTDNDGIPDLLELELGTNPFHWDTDGDGLPDGWELSHTNLNPLKASTNDLTPDGATNNDGDFMAVLTISGMTNFAIEDDEGRAAYYTTKMQDLSTSETQETVTFRVGGKVYGIKGFGGDVTDFKLEYVNEVESRLHLNQKLSWNQLYVVEHGARGPSAELDKGAVLDEEPKLEEIIVRRLNRELKPSDLNDFKDRVYEAWRYGNSSTIQLGRDLNKVIDENRVLVVYGENAAVQLLHHQVYQVHGFYWEHETIDPANPKPDVPATFRELGLQLNVDMGTGFNPLTAWYMDSQGKVNSRWDNGHTPIFDPASSATLIGMASNGSAIDTAGYSAADEFLLMNFKVHCGQIAPGDIVPNDDNTLAKIWGSHTTRAGVPTPANGEAAAQGPAADSDGDGCPDGWELYISCGPGTSYKVSEDDPMIVTGNRFNNTLTFNVRVNTLSDAGHKDVNVNPITGATELDTPPVNEFRATDTCAAYANCPSIAESNGTWTNKQLPTDPWSSDTDGDGIIDSKESTFFRYSKSTASGKFCNEGGGLNPCSWDTDFDGLPDPWEQQFAGTYVTTTNRTKVASIILRDYERKLAAAAYSSPHAAANTNILARLAANFSEDDANALEIGLDYFCGGMDGTSADSYTHADSPLQIMWKNADFDFDGLDPWQEYLTGLVRPFRYDDPMDDWQVVTKGASGLNDIVVDPTWTFEQTAAYLRGKFGPYLLSGESPNPIVDAMNPNEIRKGSNPNLVFDRFDAWGAYGSVQRRKFDQAYGMWYYFPDGPNHCLMTSKNAYRIKLEQEGFAKFLPDNPTLEQMADPEYRTWTAPSNYASTDPTSADSDGDGMDDYYELFHGLNPLYGGSGAGAKDLISQTWGGFVTATKNRWTVSPRTDLGFAPRGDTPAAQKLDFAHYPWMAGDPAADPDGDDIRNIEEAIQAGIENSNTYLHTDPTPLWMTDSSYPFSIVNLFYRLPTSADQAPAKSYAQYYRITADEIASYASHRWGADVNWSFEENEGYDSDHDGLSDYQEGAATAAGESNPQDESDPARRQAMYFPGESKPSALQTRIDPVFYAGVRGFDFQEFTIECWVKPEDMSRDQVIMERTIHASASNPNDENYYRRTFELGINSMGRFYVAYDHNGTGSDRIIATKRTENLPNVWAHVAATYDGHNLSLYVNGQLESTVGSTLHPATPATTVSYDIIRDFWESLTWESVISHEMNKIADENGLIFGASAAYHGQEPGPSALTLSEISDWSLYDKFYQGYLDEVRIWSGARTVTEISADYKKRYTAEDVIANRNDVYEAWAEGATRHDDSETVLPPELIYHYNFSGLFAGAKPEEVATSPFGYASDETDTRAQIVRPVGYTCRWWEAIGVKSEVYTDYSYVPWIPNTVARLPRFDGTTLDSRYWSQDYAAFTSAMSFGFDKFLFPRTRELYPSYKPVNTLFIPETRVMQIGELNTNPILSMQLNQAFAERSEGLYTTDLLPLGNAFVKYSNDMWDDLGPSTTWEVIGTDMNNNGIGDWWEIAKGIYAQNLRPTDKLPGTNMTVVEAYRRDIAAGAHPNAVTGDTNFVQNDDANGNGLPDWWERLYQLNGATGYDDSDGDGLSNYAEYLLSEVFDLGKTFDPTNPKSVDAANLDYFYPVGQLYAGEIFTDHDLIEDVWEDQYAANPKAVTRLAYDSHVDNDGDGWSNGAEARYSQMSREIAADQVNHYDVLDQLVADYPIPSINLTVRYNGLDRNTVEKAPLVVAASADPMLCQDYNATWYVAGADGETASESADQTGEEGKNTFVLGKWSNRHVVGSLTPGNVKADSIVLQTAYDPSVQMYSWTLFSSDYVYRGTRDDFQDAQRKYGKKNVRLCDMSTTFSDLTTVNKRTDEETQTVTMYLTGTQKAFCTVNIKTGEFDIDLGVFKGLYATLNDDESQLSSCEDLTYRFAYQTNPSVGLPRSLYLGQADIGHVYEGKNAFVAWAETENVNGQWDPGEPFGFVKDVDVGWNKATAEIELTNTHPVFARVKIATGENDRQYWWGTESGNITNHVEGVLPSERMVRVRVVRSSVNGHALAPKYQDYNGQLVKFDDFFEIENRVVLDKRIDLGVRDYIHEGDFMMEDLNESGDRFDIDWNTFEDDVVYNKDVQSTLGEMGPTHVTYRIVLGEGSVSPLTTNNLASVIVTRAFDATTLRNIAQPKLEGGNVFEARPTLEWTMNNANSYPAFRVAVYGNENFADPIWTSEVMVAPIATLSANSTEGKYSWKLPVAVGERFPGTEKILENDKEYYWSVMMYNSKFREYIHDDVAEYTEKGVSCGKFRMAVPSKSSARGSAQVCVKYFGPKATYTKGKWVKGPVRVQAFASPDFTGDHVAGATVDVSSLATTGKHEVNATVIGIPAGTYYFLAYVDANDNGRCDVWESKGYLCARGTTSPTPFNPTGVHYETDVVGPASQFDIYLEDADTDNDSLPDGWEYATYGDLATIGTESLESGTTDSAETTAIGISIYKELVAGLGGPKSTGSSTAGMAGTVLMALANPNVAGLILGLEKDENGSFILPAPTVLENGLTIKAVVFEPAAGTVKMTVAAQAEGVSSTIYATQSTATVKLAIEYSEDLSSWTKTEPITISVKAGTTEETVDVTVDALKGSKAGFFRVSIEQ